MISDNRLLLAMQSVGVPPANENGVVVKQVALLKVAYKDHAVRACYAALRMQEAIRRFCRPGYQPISLDA